MSMFQITAPLQQSLWHVGTDYERIKEVTHGEEPQRMTYSPVIIVLLSPCKHYLAQLAVDKLLLVSSNVRASDNDASTTAEETDDEYAFATRKANLVLQVRKVFGDTAAKQQQERSDKSKQAEKVQWSNHSMYCLDISISVDDISFSRNVKRTERQKSH